MTDLNFVTRFAPSPTGPLHLGHAFSALTAHDAARKAGGTFILRLDDLDQSRCRNHWEDQIYEDLNWLGITWDRPIVKQSNRLERYQLVLGDLWNAGLLFACTCSRADIKAAAHAPQEGTPLIGPDGIVYPGTCRRENNGPIPTNCALRIHMRKATQDIANVAFSKNSMRAERMISGIGDVVLARRDMGAAYHLASVLDDADLGVTHVIRGQDLEDATFIHILLQRLLDLPMPTYVHHRLIRDDAGKRLAKRDDARSIAKYREDGLAPNDIRRLVGLPLAVS